MKIILEESVKVYLNKNHSQTLVVDMIREETSSGCSCGMTKKYYTPFVRIGKTQEKLSSKYTKYEVDGIDVFMTQRAVSDAENSVTIYLEKTLFIKQLAIKGIKRIVE